MRIQVLSDLHLEYAPLQLDPVDADVTVFAGDIAPGTRGVDWVNALPLNRPSIYVAGNHEFYGQEFPLLTERLRERAADEVHFLQDQEVVIAGVRFLGCSLWSDFSLAGADNLDRSMSTCERVVNDYKQISSSQTGGSLRAAQTLASHRSSRAWLERKLGEAHDGPTVVVTHHSPITRRPPPNPVLAAVASSFASDLSDLMGAGGPQVWIFGHIHRCVDLQVGGTRVISNQRGYPREPVDGFDPGLVIEV